MCPRLETGKSSLTPCNSGENERLRETSRLHHATNFTLKVYALAIGLQSCSAGV